MMKYIIRPVNIRNDTVLKRPLSLLLLRAMLEIPGADVLRANSRTIDRRRGLGDVDVQALFAVVTVGATAFSRGAGITEFHLQLSCSPTVLFGMKSRLWASLLD